MENEKNKEALAIVKQMVVDGQISQDVAEKYFPELKESEDERMRRWIINYLDNKAINSGIIQEKTNIKNAIAWLEKQGEQKPQRMVSAEAKEAMYNKPAWSEQEQVRINRIVACLENLNVADNDILLKDVEWLKSLRPQNAWKPSDEQMEAVKCAALDVSKFSLRSEQLRLENEPYYKALVSLYQDLKKLTE